MISIACDLRMADMLKTKTTKNGYNIFKLINL